MKKTFIIVFLLLSQLAVAQTNENNHPWLDETKSFEERADLLISAMTLEEKASQMLHNSAAIPRLGIAEYCWWNEALHGVARSAKATVFPQAIGLAASFDDDLLFRTGAAVSDEARAINNELIRKKLPMSQYMGLTFWSPNVNIFRDPRWGRGQETYGEDPLLSGSLGAAFIRGMQGDDNKYLKVAAGAKHFAVHSGPEAQRHGFNAVASKKDLAETYLPAFKLCVDAGVEAIMCAYNRTNGAPCCGSEELLVGILRQQWGFTGHVVSDCWGISDIHQGHQFTETALEATALALLSGVNLNCGVSYKNLPEAVAKGLTTEEQVDESLRTLLLTRFRLGMFDTAEGNPYRAIGIEVINSKKHQDLALEAARKSIVLLQNKNNVLPLDPDSDFIYICGPLADRDIALLGNYNGLSPHMTTILEGIVDRASTTTKMEFRAGALLNTPNQNNNDWQYSLASQADATIAVVGFSVLLEGEEGETIATDKKGDILDMKLPETQINFLRQLSNDKKPLIVVICAGCPVDVSEIKELADAILFVWYPGEQGGNAVADVIFGNVSPSGKLPITFPVSAEQLPAFNNYSMQGRTYKYFSGEPQYPFGFGLSYTSFRFDEISLSSDVITIDKGVTATVSIENTGSMAADEVVQVYLSLDDAPDSPINDLIAFKRINLKPGEQRELNFLITKGDLHYYSNTGQLLDYTGAVKLTIANSSPGKRSQELGAALVSTYLKAR